MGGKYHKKISFKGDCFTKWELPKYNLKLAKKWHYLKELPNIDLWPMNY